MSFSLNTLSTSSVVFRGKLKHQYNKTKIYYQNKSPDWHLVQTYRKAILHCEFTFTYYHEWRPNCSLTSEVIFLYVVIIYSNKWLNIKQNIFNINYEALTNLIGVIFSYYFFVFTYFTICYYYFTNILFDIILYKCLNWNYLKSILHV